MTAPPAKDLMRKMGVLSEAELTSRCHVRFERYVKNLMIEVDTVRQMVDTQILPAGLSYHGKLVADLSACRAAGVESPQEDSVRRLTVVLNSLKLKREELEHALQKVERHSTEEERAEALAGEVSERMLELRRYCDDLESMVADDCWPLPKYREMLFIS